jgi:hypothetical protein
MGLHDKDSDRWNETHESSTNFESDKEVQARMNIAHCNLTSNVATEWK